MYIAVEVSQLAIYLVLHQIWIADSLTHQLSNSVTLFHCEEEQEMETNSIAYRYPFIKDVHILLMFSLTKSMIVQITFMTSAKDVISSIIKFELLFISTP